jgi:membrane-associated phospholipid phosphatase
MIIRYFISLVLSLACICAVAQTDTISPMARQDGPAVKPLIIPTALTVYGFAALKAQFLQDFDHHIQDHVSHGRTNVDDFLQYSPGAAFYMLTAAGVKGRHGLGRGTILYAMTTVAAGGSAFVLKKLIHSSRPDGSDNEGFPSAHMAIVFSGAEFLRQEFRDHSPWIGIAGYAVATATGYLRVYNEQHWFSQLLAGAGVGMITAKLSYWVFPWVERKLLNPHKIFYF